MLEALGALVPSIGVGLLFWYVVRAMIHADRRERAAVAAMERADRARAGQERAGQERAGQERREKGRDALTGDAPVSATDDAEHLSPRSDR
ncbi:hypothetical protein ACFP6A_01625 [Quadrisphaera sp. GCM10027208]|uniref:hypothetical protein n=1 Tax=Quadrisphaera sp. GCM10027208 TaxID=3273423 RepID=UPI0036066E13|nr:hypothetical protein HJG43_01600 [Kineosporiaceae bacterium SCSIO 59966]